MDALSRATRALLPLAPRFIVRPVGLRYVAGESLADALGVVDELGEKGVLSTLDVLGEQVRDENRAREAVDQYRELVDALGRQAPGSTVSVKPTLMGLSVSRELARENMAQVYRAADGTGIGVQIDMEDHETTDDTLWLYETLQGEYGNGGVALQARLRRTLQDAGRIDPTGAVRLCKGIYQEPPEIAFTGDQEINDSYIQVLERLLGRGVYVGIATHDDLLVERALELLHRGQLEKGDYEFQMLLGVRESLRDRLVADGHRVRVYVPYGRDWYDYSIRRLRENPRMARHVLRSLLLDD